MFTLGHMLNCTRNSNVIGTCLKSSRAEISAPPFAYYISAFAKKNLRVLSFFQIIAKFKTEISISFFMAAKGKDWSISDYSAMSKKTVIHLLIYLSVFTNNENASNLYLVCFFKGKFPFVFYRVSGD